MILKSATLIKNILKINKISFEHPVCSKDVSRVTRYIADNRSNEISTHIHLSHDPKERDKICQFPNMEEYSNYSRSNITYVDGIGIVDEPVTVPVLKCKNCDHYHAVLPSALIIPHYRYSIFFIFKVLYDKKYNHLTVNEIIEKYQIAVSTLYRWIERFLSYFRYYMYSRKNPKQEGMLEDLLEDHEGVIRDICNFSSRTIMQLDRRLINSSGYSKNCT